MKTIRLHAVLRGCVVLLLAGLLAGGTTWAAEAVGGNDEKPHRRIIVNDDGEVLLPGGDRSWDDYLGETTFEVELSAPPLRQGINHLVFLPGPKSSGRLGSRVTGLELSVGYK